MPDSNHHPSLSADSDLAARFKEGLVAMAAGDGDWLRRGRWVTTRCLIQIGAETLLVAIERGVPALIDPIPLLCSWDFAIRAPATAWQALWQSLPAAGWHDIFALAKRGELRIEGNLHPLMSNLQYFKDMLSLAATTGQTTAILPSQPILEPIVGRYISVTVLGETQRIYFEEAGSGIPLVCLHTAGADSRQFRHLLCDDAISRHFRVIAFDLPWHGKSFPPVGWQQTEYRLTTERYVDTVRAFCAALAIERPVVMGCSIGGRLVLQLAHAHGSEFRALIGLEAADYQQPWYDTSWLHRPDVHGGEVCAALISGLIAPQSPAQHRHETLWQYLQGGPGVFKGDLYFYRVDGDLRGKLNGIDTTQCPLYLLTGEYDFSCTPQDTLRTAQAIPGAKVVVMRELGHFPMSENPAQFRTYLLPVLDEIRARVVS